MKSISLILAAVLLIAVIDTTSAAFARCTCGERCGTFMCNPDNTKGCDCANCRCRPGNVGIKRCCSKCRRGWWQYSKCFTCKPWQGCSCKAGCH